MSETHWSWGKRDKWRASSTTVGMIHRGGDETSRFRVKCRARPSRRGVLSQASEGSRIDSSTLEGTRTKETHTRTISDPHGDVGYARESVLFVSGASTADGRLYQEIGFLEVTDLESRRCRGQVIVAVSDPRFPSDGGRVDGPSSLPAAEVLGKIETSCFIGRSKNGWNSNVSSYGWIGDSKWALQSTRVAM